MNPWLCVGIPIFLMPFNAVIARMLLLQGCGACDVQFYRSLGAILMGIILYRSSPFLCWRSWFSVPGIFCASNLFCFNMALKYMSGYMVMVLETSCFLFSMLYSVICREKFVISISAIVCFLGGLGLLLWDAGQAGISDPLRGLFWGILAAATFGAFNSALAKQTGKYPRLFTIMMPCLLFSLPGTAWHGIEQLPDVKSLLISIGLIGMLTTGVSYYLWSIASRQFNGVQLSQWFLLTLPGTFLVEKALLGISLSYWQIAASLLLLCGTVLNIRIGMEAEAASVSPPQLQ